MRRMKRMSACRVAVVVGVSFLLLSAPGDLLAQPSSTKAAEHAGEVPASDGGATGVTSGPRTAQPATFYTDRAGFVALFPGLTLEDFEDLDVTAGTFCTGSSPLDASTNDPGCVSPGDIATGLRLEVLGAPGPYVAFGASFLTNPSVVVGPNSLTDNSRLRFPDTVAFAVGFDIACPSVAGVLSVAVQGVATGPMGSTTINCTDFPGGFLGILASDPIGSITVSSAGNVSEMYDNVLFGTQQEDLLFDFGPAFGTWVLYDNGPQRTVYRR